MGVPITPMIGKILYLLAKIQGARRILEIGSLGGYSTLWLAKALPADGQLLSIEIEKAHAAATRRRGDPRIQVVEGDGHDLLAKVEGPFDLIFLDADKQGYPDYLEPMVALCRAGSLIVSDNLIRKGKVIEPNPSDPVATALSRYNERVAADPRLEAIILPTYVGVAGGQPDGLGLARVC